MGLLTKLKSVLGLEREERPAGNGSDVTVERGPSTESEEAVKEPAEESPDGTEMGVDEPVATETDAAASTESLVDEEHTDDPTRAAEPAEAAGAGGGKPAETVTDGEDVSTVKGIGPAYAERLHEAGIDSVADLAAADVETLAEDTDLSEKRVGRWVENAQSQD